VTKVDIFPVTGEQRQRFEMDCARIAVASYGAQFEGRLDAISLLLSIRPDRAQFDELFKKKFGDDIFKKLDRIKLDIAIMVSYKSDIDNKVLSREDVTSLRFINYQKSLSRCFLNLFLLDELWHFLRLGTDLEKTTIPHHYFSYVLREEIKMPEESSAIPDAFVRTEEREAI